MLLSTAVAFLFFMYLRLGKFAQFTFAETFWVIFPVFVISYLGSRLDIIIHDNILLQHEYHLRNLFKLFFTDSGYGNGLGITFSIFSLFFITHGLIPENKFLPALDKFIFLVSFCYIFGNLGCFFDGHLACRGIPTTMPWGCKYTFTTHPSILPLHPLKLYYSIFFILLTLFLAVIKPLKNGKLYVIGMLIVLLFFYFMDFLRTNRYNFGLISFRQLIYLLNALLAGIFYFVKIKKSHK